MESKLNEFEILNKLGEGSFGLVYKVRRKVDRNIYVMKQINISKMNQRMKNDALNEATILSKIDSQFIVKYYESFIEKNLLCIVMEFCEGGDLHKYLKLQMGRPLQENQIWKIVLQTTLGLAYLHKLKILHRDIKAMNVFMAKDSIRIGDLGVAKLLSDQNNFARTMVGTPYYLSPEMCEEKPYNEKSDIWALGCVIYELCTFRHPFEAQNQGALVLKIIRGRYEPIPTMYSQALSKLIDLCLQKDYRTRPDAFDLLQQQCVLQASQSLRLPLNLHQPHPLSKGTTIICGTPIITTKATPVHVPLKAQPVKVKPNFEVRGKEAPIKETPIVQKKEIRVPPPQNVIVQVPAKMDEFYKDWREKVQELQKPKPESRPESSKQQKPSVLINQSASNNVQVTQPSKKPVIVKQQEKKRIRKGAPVEQARQVTNPSKKVPEECLKLLKSKQNPKQYTSCSPEEVDQVLNLPDFIKKEEQLEIIIQPKKEIMDLSQFLQDDDIPTTEMNSEQIENHDFIQYQQDEEDEQQQSQEQQPDQDSDRGVYTEGSQEEEETQASQFDQQLEQQEQENQFVSDDTIYFQEQEQQKAFATIQEEQFEDTQQGSFVELILDNKKLDLNKKLLEAEKRKIELDQILKAKTQECIREMGSKLYEEVIGFLRNKLNSQDELNDRDQEEIDEMVTEKMLKIRNPQVIYTIYKILHFEIEISKAIEKIAECTQSLESL